MYVESAKGGWCIGYIKVSRDGVANDGVGN